LKFLDPSSAVGGVLGLPQVDDFLRASGMAATVSEISSPP
jgi:hypothetical protein